LTSYGKPVIGPLGMLGFLVLVVVLAAVFSLLLIYVVVFVGLILTAG
jgi:hypothetical protein